MICKISRNSNIIVYARGTVYNKNFVWKKLWLMRSNFSRRPFIIIAPLEKGATSSNKPILHFWLPSVLKGHANESSPFVFNVCSLFFSFLVLAGSGQCFGEQLSLLLKLKNSLKFNSILSTKLVHWSESTDCFLWKLRCNLKRGTCCSVSTWTAN